MSDDPDDALLVLLRTKALLSPVEAQAYATLRLALAVDEWLQGCCAELGRIANALGSTEAAD